MQRVRGRMAVVLMVAGVCAAWPVVAAQAGSPSRDSVNGAGENNADVNAHFAFNVQANADGSNPFGEAHFKVTTDQSDVKHGTFGSPTCLIVKGNRASFIFAADHTGRDAEFDTIGGVQYAVLG